jgi:enamine deaminase RidA (YjgF/YER057c/UK114 family)
MEREEQAMTNKVELVRSDQLVPPAGLYSHAAFVQGPARLVAIAGQLAVDRQGSPVGAGSFAEQFGQVFGNLGEVLAVAGSSWAQVLKFTTYLVRADDISGFYDERAKLFPTLFAEKAYPPNTLLVIQRLVKPEFLIEVEALAVAGEG